MHRILTAAVLSLALAQGPAFAHSEKSKSEPAKDGKSQPKSDHKGKGHGHDKKH